MKVIVFTRLLKNTKGDFLGEFESLNQAITDLANARNDNDYSEETFNECYISYNEDSLAWQMHKRGITEEEALQEMFDIAEKTFHERNKN
jgi:hypothetical protein